MNSRPFRPGQSQPAAIRQGETTRSSLNGMDAHTICPAGMGGLRRLQNPARFDKPRFEVPLYPARP